MKKLKSAFGIIQIPMKIQWSNISSTRSLILIGKIFTRHDFFLWTFVLWTACVVNAQENPFLDPPAPQTQYQRTDFKSTYSLEKLQAAADLIRNAPRPDNPGPLLKDKVMAAVQRSAALRAECVTIAATTTERLEMRCLANTALWLGGDATRLATALDQYRTVINTQTQYNNHEYYFEPLLLEWLKDYLTSAERQAALDKYLAYAQPGVTPVQDYNNPVGIKLLGLATQDLNAAESIVHGGAVFGDPSLWDPGAVTGRKQTLALQSLICPEGPNIEGLSYTGYHGPFLFFALAWRELTNQDFFRLRLFQEWPLHFCYESGNNLEFMDAVIQEQNRSWIINGQNFYPILAGFEVGLTASNRELAGLCKSFLPADKYRYLGLPMWLLYEALRDPTLQPVAKNTLPLTRIFRGCNYICSRSSWEGPDATILIVRAPIYKYRESGAAGEINIWKNGSMLLPKHMQQHNYAGGARGNMALLYRDDSPGVEYAPMGTIDNVKSFNDVSFSGGGPSFSKVNALPVRDMLESVTDSAAELHIVLRGKNVWHPTAGDIANPNTFTYVTTKPSLERDMEREIVWNKQTDEITIHDRVILQSGEQAQLRWNFQPQPIINGNKVTAISDFTTEYNTAHGKIVLETLLPANPNYWLVGGAQERNKDPFGALRKANMLPSFSTLPIDDWRNLIAGTYRVQVPSDTGEWLTSIRVMDKDQGEVPPQVTLSAIDSSASEAGLDKGVFRFSRSGSTASELTVAYNLSGGALNGSDYETLPGSVIIPAGASSVDVAVTPIDDTEIEEIETIIATIATSSSYTIGTSNSISIDLFSDDLPVVTVTATDSTVTEAGDQGVFRFLRTGGTSSSLTVNYSIDGTAKNGVDYQTLSGSVIIPVGASSIDVVLIPIDDSIMEGDESIILTLASDAGYTIGSSNEATVLISASDQPVVTVTASDAISTEPKFGRNEGRFVIKRTESTTVSLTVQYAMSGTAGNGTDYKTLSGTVIIPAGTDSVKITLTPRDDVVVEGSETAILTLMADSNYQIGSASSATVTILGEDMPIINVTASDSTAAEAGLDKGTFAITRSGKLDVEVTVNYVISGDAQMGVDYQSIGNSVTILAGQTSVPIDVVPIDDSLVEKPEKVSLTLLGSSSYSISTPDPVTVKISSND